MPAPKTLTERNLVPDLFVTERHEFAPVGTRNHRTNRESGNAPGLGDRVAVHAAARPFDHRQFAAFRLVEDIEDSSQLGIERNNFDFTAGNVADVDVLVEIHRPRIAPRDVPCLEAGPGENQQLGTGRNIKMFQQAGDECRTTAVVEFALPGFEIFYQPGERIVEFPGVVFMGRTVRVVIIDVLPDGRMRHRQDDENQNVNLAHRARASPSGSGSTTPGIPPSGRLDPSRASI